MSDDPSSSTSPNQLPTFDARAITYPTKKVLRDYLCWRQVDAHINNLYNTTFWTLVQRGGLSRPEAEEKLKGTLAKDKHEVLFSYGINYNQEEEMYKKGSVVYRELPKQDAEVVGDGEKLTKKKDIKEYKRRLGRAEIVVRHVDVIGDEFWREHAYLLGEGEE